MDRARLPGLVKGQRHPDWQRLYETAGEESLPWYFRKMDPDIQRALLLVDKGRLLDVGCGLGNQSAHFHALGFDVTGTDVSRAAVERARSLYPGPRFEVDDVTQTFLDDKFDIVVDRGCFHVIDPHFHARYVTSTEMWLKPGGLLLLKVFCAEDGIPDFGPQRFCAAQLRNLFESAFEIVSIERAFYQNSTAKSQKALFATMKRKSR